MGERSDPPAGCATAIIPARLGSSRFPGKVLAAATGRPMVQHVAEAAGRARSVGRVVVAADDPRIGAALAPFGTEVVLTRADHANGTSRLAEAAALLGLEAEAIVTNVQGDEPDLDPGAIDAAVGALLRTGAPMATAAAPMAEGEEAADAAVVKVVRRLDGTALYFSRSVIPFDRDGRGGAAARPLRHVGVYAYRRSFLERYAAMAPTPLERVESLEQLRVLEHGHAIAVALCERAAHGVDTPEQYEAFVRRWRDSAGR
jgi:3-deoxy-manno-octulosonate cytidylyltransferase (CMP-KDO synthetase)